MHLQLQFGADALAVRAALQRVLAAGSGRLGRRDAGVLELVLAEALNNVVEHAYAGRGGAIVLSVEIGDTVVRCCLADQGRAMPGLVLPPPRPPCIQPGGGRPLCEGGWGWHLIRSLARDLTYARIGEENRLSFLIDLSPDHGQGELGAPPDRRR